ncbi:UDP-glycosyltransferase 92a1 [Phtheirospermum japonicum]|uniref:UDP-glycosyltransferase 92a1 n=1 Tax=Phtheirospermum japonicum TaxID=374723 RepID=A0A830B617_9LAMI|nr:UDP-glycosyltransferase 92a1 [Phtheirospermum japonicum]
MEWLDSKPKRSVLYISFGSQASPSEMQTMELAKALEASNVNFLWVFRAPTDNNNIKAANKDDFLPTGFEDRIKASDKGLLVENWAPQTEILAHESVGAFLSHCGWNSMIEALSEGVPMLTWPMAGDQPFNARFLEKEIGASVGVANGVVSEVKCEEMVKKIELIMKDGDGDGNVMRRKACEVREMIRNATYDEGGRKGSSAEAMGKFVNTFLQTRKRFESM